MNIKLNRLLGSLSVITATIVFTPNLAIAQNTLPDEKACKKIENKSTELAGWCTAVDRVKGNCLACHVMVTPKWPEGFPEGGNAAPPLVGMKARFPDKAKLRTQIYDSRIANEKSLMPPFGAYSLLTDQQIDDIVEFLYTL